SPTAHARADQGGEFSHALLCSGIEATISRIDCWMEVDFIGVGTEVVEHVQKVLLVHPATVEIAVDALSMDEARRAQLPLHTPAQALKRYSIDGLGAGVLAVEIDGQAVFLLGHPHTPHAIAGAQLDSGLKYYRVHVHVQVPVNV